MTYHLLGLKTLVSHPLGDYTGFNRRNGDSVARRIGFGVSTTRPQSRETRGLARPTRQPLSFAMDTRAPQLALAPSRRGVPS